MVYLWKKVIIRECNFGIFVGNILSINFSYEMFRLKFLYENVFILYFNLGSTRGE